MGVERKEVASGSTGHLMVIGSGMNSKGEEDILLGAGFL